MYILSEGEVKSIVLVRTAVCRKHDIYTYHIYILYIHTYLRYLGCKNERGKEGTP